MTKIRTVKCVDRDSNYLCDEDCYTVLDEVNGLFKIVLLDQSPKWFARSRFKELVSEGSTRTCEEAVEEIQGVIDGISKLTHGRNYFHGDESDLLMRAVDVLMARRKAFKEQGREDGTT